MAEIVWDQVGTRFYEAGLDRGVLYLADGTAVPWNGLVSVAEKVDNDSSPVYFDGRKISDLVAVGDFAASLRALTYPDEFSVVEGVADIRDGFTVDGQQPQLFGLSYRTRIGNDLGDENYKLHVLYNLTAIPRDKTYSTLSEDLNAMTFEWDLFAVPVDVPGYRPTAHLIFDSRNIDDFVLSGIENLLYGDAENSPELVSVVDILTFIDTFVRWNIIDHGDGTWSATTPADIPVTADGVFTLNDITATYLDEVTYQVTAP